MKIRITIFLQRHSTLIFMCMIMLIGSFLRLYRFYAFDFYADSARDILVAKHIIEFDGFKNIGPGAAAGWGLIHNSPLYFWLLAIFWFYTRSPMAISLVFVLFGVVTIFVGYKIGWIIAGRSTGLMLALFISVSSIFIEYSRSVFQPHLIPLVTLASIYAFLKTMKTKSVWWFLLYIQIVFIGLHIHYSFIPVFVVFALWGIWHWFVQGNRSSMWATLISFIFCVIQFLIWVKVTSVNTSFDQVRFFATVVQKFIQSSNPSIILTRFYQPVYNLFSLEPGGAWISFIVMVTIVYVGVADGLKQPSRRRAHSMFFVASLALSLLVTTAYIDSDAPRELYPHYYAPYYGLVLILMANAIHTCITRFYAKMVLVVVCCYFLFHGAGLFSALSLNRYEAMREISQSIFTDFSDKYDNGEEFVVYDHNPNEAQFDYYIGQYYYFLESYVGKSLVFLTNNDHTIFPRTLRPSAYYLVCSWFPAHSTEVTLQTKCAMPFKRQFLGRKRIMSEVCVREIKAQARSFYIYRFDVNPANSIPPYSNQNEQDIQCW